MKAWRFRISIPYIEGEPEISSVAVSPGETNTKPAEQISGTGTEDRVSGEGVIYYDIRFFVYLPERKTPGTETGTETEKGRKKGKGQKRKKIKVLINVEAQKNFWPGYRIETRGIFYACRMIPAQLGTEFSIPDYDGIKKSVSIWICMNAGVRAGNAISEYCLQKKDLVEGIPDVPDAYDKISVILITLNQEAEAEDELLQMLNTLLASGMDVTEKKKKLEERFHISMEGNAGKEMDLMCNLSGYVWEQGEKSGMKKGVQKGVQNEKKETAERMLKSGRFSHEEIALSTGLSEEMIRKIEEEILTHA